MDPRTQKIQNLVWGHLKKETLHLNIEASGFLSPVSPARDDATAPSRKNIGFFENHSQL